MSADSLEILNREYQAGQVAFERGAYRQSVQHLEQAVNLVERNTSLGGEIQIWLVTAYEAAGQRPEALQLCRQMQRHPHWDTRKQSKRLLYILEAPQLVRRPEWLTEIPDLSKLDEDNQPSFWASTDSGVPQPQEPKKFIPEVVDLSQVNTQDNQFVWLALVITGLVIGGLYWLS